MLIICLMHNRKHGSIYFTSISYFLKAETIWGYSIMPFPNKMGAVLKNFNETTRKTVALWHPFCDDNDLCKAHVFLTRLKSGLHLQKYQAVSSTSTWKATVCR